MSISKTVQATEKERIFRIKLLPILLLSLAVLLLSAPAFAAPNSMTLQGKLTNLAGASQQGTFNFTFRIYDAAANGNGLWEIANYNVTTDANGVYDVILGGINLSFADQYYLGITIGSDNESAPRINLTSAPYSFRANTSEALNPNASYFVSNLSVAGNATVGSGATKIDISTQGFNFSSATGNLNINGTITAKSFAGDGSLLSGISSAGIFNSSGANVYLNDSTANLGLGLSSPSDRLVVIGSVRISNSLNATFINATRIMQGLNLVQTVESAFNLANYSAEYASTGYKLANLTNYLGDANFNSSVLRVGNISSLRESLYNLGNFSSNYDARADRFGIANGTALAFSNMQLSNISNTTSWSNIINIPAFSNFQLSNVSNVTSWSNIINIPALSNFQISNVSNDTLRISGNSSIALWNRTSAAVYLRSAELVVKIGNISDNLLNNYVNDTLAVFGSAAVYGSLNATYFNSTSILQNGNKVQTVESIFNLANLTGFLGVSNSSIIRTENVSSFVRTGDGFTNTNFTSRLNAANDSISLWNISGANIFQRFITGLVGIGTILPSDTLHVLGTTRLTVNDTNNFSTATVLTLDHLINNPLNSTGGIGIGMLFRALDNGSNVDNVALINATLTSAINGSEDSSLGFYTRNGGGALTPRLFINGSNVGIGTTGPNDILEVVGNVRVSGSLNTTSVNATRFSALAGNTNVIPVYTFNGNTNTGIWSSATNELDIGTNGVRRWNIDGNGNILQVGSISWASVFGAASDVNIYRGAANQLKTDYNLEVVRTINASSINTTGSAYFAINSGRVGIGTTNPAHKLSVDGAINASSTLFAPVVNSTQNNLTISSAAGSVIIRLG